MGDCITPEQANDFLSKDANRISGKIARSLALNSPWINIIETGTFAAGVSCTQRSVVAEAIAPILSQCNPVWDTFVCDVTPQTVCYGSTEYTYSPERRFERSCPFCLELAFCAFRNAIKRVEESYSDHVQTLWNTWIRRKVLDLSATKVIAATGLPFSSILATGFRTAFPLGVIPNAGISFKFLKFLANYLMHERLAGSEFQWADGMMKHYRFISDQATIDGLRAEIDVRQDLRFTAAGCCDRTKDLFSYSWEGPYQGIMFGVDQSPLRASGINTATGQICCVEPFLQEAATQGTKRVVNPAWLSAPYQVSFLLAKGTFVREIPEEYLGEGMTKFERQNWAGKVTWHNVRDNDCNVLGDRGFHYWNLAAAFRPERPEFAIAILHIRCPDDLGLTACTPTGYYTLCV